MSDAISTVDRALGVSSQFPALHGMRVIVPEWPGLPAGVRALTTLRAGGASVGHYGDGVPAGASAGAGNGGGFNLGRHVGDSPAAVLANRERLRSLLPAEPAWLTQVHGTVVADAAQVSASGRSGIAFRIESDIASSGDADGAAAIADAPEADASIAVGPGAVCAIMTADCLPVLFCGVREGVSGPERFVVGGAHAGWRGLLHGVLENTVAAMRAAGARDIGAWLGPAIGPLRFEVGAEVRDAYLAQAMGHAGAFVAIDGKPGKYLADIYRLARNALAAIDVRRVAGGDFCTVDDAVRFYSYRRDGVTGRFATLIWVA